jgi:hypothetical protein
MGRATRPVAPAEPDRGAWSIRIPPSRREKLGDFRVALWADQKGYSVAACDDGAHRTALGGFVAPPGV